MKTKKSKIMSAFIKIFKCDKSQAEYEYDILRRCGFLGLSKKSGLSLLTVDGNWQELKAKQFIKEIST
jgi:hypothetical protein